MTREVFLLSFVDRVRDFGLSVFESFFIGS